MSKQQQRPIVLTERGEWVKESLCGLMAIASVMSAALILIYAGA